MRKLWMNHRLNVEEGVGIYFFSDAGMAKLVVRMYTDCRNGKQWCSLAQQHKAPQICLDPAPQLHWCAVKFHGIIALFASTHVNLRDVIVRPLAFCLILTGGG